MTAALRPPGEVMRLARLGASWPTRLSFMRRMIRCLAEARAVPERGLWRIDAQGHGEAVYTVRLGGHAYSLVAVSRPLDPEARTDRVIAEAWDTAYVLYDGVPDAAEVARIAATAPRQEAARFSPRDLVLSRANKSVRLFEHVVAALAAGRQPDRELVARTGYLMRTTAVYGNGKFGIADRGRLAGRAVMDAPFAAEMLTVWLIRGFTHDLVEHVARARAPGAAPLSRALRRHLGIGNSTGLGMAPFLVSHPLLLDAWIGARETALARVRAVERIGAEEAARGLELIDRARAHLDQWTVEDARQMARIETARAEMAAIAGAAPRALAGRSPWDALVRLGATRSAETAELLVSLALEPNPGLVDGLAETMGAPDAPALDPAMTVAALRALVARDWAWALGIDFRDAAETHLFWYVSEEKLEPRLGLRAAEPGADREMPLDVARRVQALARALAEADGGLTLARLLLARPDLRDAALRVQTLARHPYAEIRDNLIGRACLPIDLLRAKLAVFGASKFDPLSDRWTRITLYQGAPTAAEIAEPGADDWAFPVIGADDALRMPLTAAT